MGSLQFGDFLFSRVVTNQVPSALGDLTSVFGMSTGVSLLPSSPYSSFTLFIFSNNITGQAFNLLVSVSLRCYHPYTSDLSTSFSSRNLFGNLILRWASYLDAFSSYLFQTQLSSSASGETTRTPAVCPSRSSRTKDSSSQISFAHGGQGPNCLTTF